MTQQREIIEAIKARLMSAGIGYESINVFGSIRCNVHVTCVSRETAQKWQALLAQVFRGVKVGINETVWDAKENKGTNLRPTKRTGYLVSVMA